MTDEDPSLEISDIVSEDPVDSRPASASRPVSRPVRPSVSGYKPAAAYEKEEELDDGSANKVAILGFNASGKTTYLAMLYFETAVRGRKKGKRMTDGDSGHTWRADWFVLDRGKTQEYMSGFYREILGFMPDGRRRWKDATRQEVVRKMLDGTTDQKEISFRLICENDLRDEILDVETLDGAGEVLYQAAVNPQSLSLEYRDRWNQFKALCGRSGAILIFAGLMRMEDYDLSAPMRALVDTLVNQESPPKVVVFVLTGTDIYADQNMVDEKVELFEDEYHRSIEVLKKAGIETKVVAISSFGPDFTRKVSADRLTNDACRSDRHYRCPECQELVPYPNAKPDPTDLMLPWDFIYEKLHQRSALVIRFLNFKEGVAKRFKWIAAAAMLAVLLSLGGLWVRALQTEKDLIALLAEGELTPAVMDRAIALDTALAERIPDKWIISPPDRNDPSDPRAALRLATEAAKVFNDESLPLENRLAAARAEQERLLSVGSNLASWVPVSRLQLRWLEEIIADPRATWRNRTDRAAEVIALAVQSNELITLKDSIATDFLNRASTWSKGLNDDISRRLDSATPTTQEDAANLETTSYILAKLDAGALGQSRSWQQLRTSLQGQQDELSRLVAFSTVLAMPQDDGEQASAKIAALGSFSATHASHKLGVVAGQRATDLREIQASITDQAAYGRMVSNAAYNPAMLSNDLEGFARVWEDRTAFLSQNSTGEVASQVRAEIAEMEQDFALEVGQRLNRVNGMLSAYETEPPPAPTPLAQLTSEFNDSRQQRVIVRQMATRLPHIAAAGELADRLELLFNIQGQYRQMAQILENMSDTDESRDAAAAALRNRARAWNAGDVARRYATQRADDLGFAAAQNRMEAEEQSLPRTSEIQYHTAIGHVEEALERYEAFLSRWSDHFDAATRTRFVAWLQTNGRRDLVTELAPGRELIRKVRDEKQLWAQIEAGLNEPNRTQATRTQLLAQIDRYIADYPQGGESATAQSVKSRVAAWSLQRLSVGVDSARLPGGGEYLLQMRIRPASEPADSPLAQERTMTFRGRRVRAGDPMAFSFWSDRAYVIQLSLFEGTSVRGSPIYQQLRRIGAGAAARELEQPFPEANNASFDFEVSRQ